MLLLSYLPCNLHAYYGFQWYLPKVFTIFTITQMQWDKVYFVLTSCVLLSCTTHFAQLQNANWALESGKQLSFNSIPPTAGISSINTSGIPSSISDAAGNLVLYSDGVSLWNGIHAQVANSTGLISGNVLIEKQPGSSNIYYLFIASTAGLYYSIIDMSLAAGQGSITTKNALIAAYPNGTNGINGVRHCNGSDFWIVNSSNVGNSLQFDARLFTSSGISTVPVSSMYGPLSVNLQLFGLVKISFSPRKNKMAFGCNFEFGLLDFDPLSGIATSSISLGNGANNLGTCFATEFSPDGTRLYGVKNTTDDIYQWNLCASNVLSILNSRYQITVPLINQNTDFADLALGIDGKIYLAQSSAKLTVINSPNALGAACNVSFAAQSPSVNGNFVQNFIKKSNFQLVPPPFTYSLTSCQVVNFNPSQITSSNQPYCNTLAGNFSGYHWDFGDPTTGAANTSTNTNPTHTFSSPGTYTVHLYRLNSCSLSADTTSQVIQIVGPTININTSNISCASLGTATVSIPSSSLSFNYLWMPSSQSGSTALGLQPGQHTVIISSGTNTCEYLKIFNLTPTNTYSFNLNFTPSVNCNGPNTATAGVLGATGGSGNQTYLWSNGQQSFSTPVVYSLSAGVWSIQITDALTGCKASQTLIISPAPLYSVALFSSSSTVCAGQSATLTGINISGPANSTYTWSNGANSPSIVISQSVAGVYIYTLSSRTINQCLASGTIALNFLALPILKVANSRVCVNSTTLLIASGNGSNYMWNSNYFLNPISGATISLTPSATQIYTVTSALNNCNATKTVELAVIEKPKAEIYIKSSEICMNDTVILESNSGAVSHWLGPFSFEMTGRIIRFKALNLQSSGNYTLNITDTNGCKNSSATYIKVLPLPSGSLIDFKEEVCVPFCKTYSFAGINSTSVQSIWQVNNTTYAGSQFNVCLSEAGTYTFVGRMQDLKTSCKAELSYLLNLHEKPKADFNYSPLHPIQEIDEVQFVNTSQGNELTKFNWFFNDNKGFNSKNENTNYLYTEPGEYPVVLIAENAWSCRDTILKIIKVDSDFAIYVPNTFTPNDDDRNDIFKPVVHSATHFDFEIYDRWGKEIFHSKSTQDGWDGSFAGEICKQDVYTWVIELTTNQGERLRKTGLVTLLR